MVKSFSFSFRLVFLHCCITFITQAFISRWTERLKEEPSHTVGVLRSLLQPPS